MKYVAIENEIFKSIEDYKDYEISNLGRVKSNRTSNEKILKPQANPQGYMIATLYSDGEEKGKQISVHKLVMNAFGGEKPLDIIKDDGKVEFIDIDHINNDKGDNRYENLRYTTHTENVDKIDRSYQTKRVVSYTVDGRMVKEYESVTSTVDDGFNRVCVGQCCNGKLETSGGLVWKFKDEEVK